MGDRLKMHALASHRHAYFLSYVIFVLFMHWRHVKSHKSNLYCTLLQKTQGYATYIDCAYPFPANVKAAFMCKIFTIQAVIQVSSHYICHGLYLVS